MNKLATQLLNVFGYVNAKEEDIEIFVGRIDFIAVGFCNKEFHFKRTATSWEMTEIGG